MGNPSISIPDPLLADADAIAYARSKPGDSVSRSEVVRKALEAYVDDHQEEVEKGREALDDPLDGAQATN